MTDLKPHLACDIDLDTVVYPLIGMPKIDGVRGINLDGAITGRSKKAFKNKFVAECFSHKIFLGIDGELALGAWNAPRLCSETTGFVNRQSPKAGKPIESGELVWWAFDYLHEDYLHLTYFERLQGLAQAVSQFCTLGQRAIVRTVPWRWIHNREDLEAYDAENLANGFEGSCFRDPNGMHKSGRCSNKVTKKNSGNAYLRLKRFIDFEGTITRMEEAMENLNEAKTNELGRTERSTHQENMAPKAMVGNLYMVALTDVEHNGEVVIQKGEEVKLGPGNMDHPTRKAVWEAYVNKTDECWVGQIGKGKFFGHGIKDKIRFGTFVCLRSEEDMSE